MSSLLSELLVRSANELDEDDIINRTNNPLESYNFRYQKLFPNSHHNGMVWHQITQAEAKAWVEKI